MVEPSLEVPQSLKSKKRKFVSWPLFATTGAAVALKCLQRGCMQTGADITRTRSCKQRCAALNILHMQLCSQH